ncbi:MAG TPA: nucleotide sugar dehydrogenase [Candidatus Eisenbacteria bacterium]|nr:nucleotide sugar dehydrogenase [Candidatus Eisenbacteria bacterium]
MDRTALNRDRSTNRLAEQPLPLARELSRKILDRSAKLGVVGLGYVGLPLAVEMAREGFRVTGVDLLRNKVEAVNSGMSYVLDVPSEALFSLVTAEKLRATQSMAAIEDLDSVNICVPTPLRKNKDPDLSYVIAAVEAIRNHIRPGQLIILESTTYPGTTREIVMPVLEESGLKAGRDFFLAYSPERVDPGNKHYTTRNIPKVVGGITATCVEVAALLYRQFITEVVTVSSTECAEMVKLLENTFRSVNIALANEMALTCHGLGINVWEVIEAAKTKPFGFMPFYPGPGLGGHCIPVDPYYLTWKAKMNGCEPRLIELAGHINGQMPVFTVRLVADALNEKGKSLKGSKVLAIGVAYKRDTNDVRESPAFQILQGLRQKGAEISFYDPHVSAISIGDETLRSVNPTPEVLASVDCSVILTDHTGIDYERIAKFSPLVVDTRNALRGSQYPNVMVL